MTVYVKNCLKCKSYAQITEILTEKFITVNMPNFAEFTNLKLEKMCNLEDYFLRKVDFGRKLVLSKSLILQGLTDGLKTEYQNVCTVNLPNTAKEWYRVAS